MAKKSNKTATHAPRAIDMPLPEPNRHSVSIKKADNGGYVVNHHGVSGGKYFDKTMVAHNPKHLQQTVSDIAKRAC